MSSKETLEMDAIERQKKMLKEEAVISKTPGSIYGKRHTQVLLMFLLIFIAYGIRTNLSVGIVAMTDPMASSNHEIPTYPNWHDKSIMLSSFFWGYIIPQIAAGWLAIKYGPKWFLVTAMMVCSLFGILLPFMAQAYGSKGVMVSRAIQGFSQGFIFPSVHTLLSKWAPASERSRMGTFVYAGGCLGTVVSMLVTGLISASSYGWPVVFYLYGAIGITWSILMACLGYNSPGDHKSISEEEKYFIESSLGHDKDSKRIPTPWKEMLSSLPVWAILITHCGQNWGFWTLMTEIPTYMSHILKFDIKSNSYLSALPYFILWILSFIFSACADYLISRKVTSIGTTRKLFNSIGLIIPGLALVFLGLVTSVTPAIVLLVIAVAVNSAIYCGFNVNHIDLSPNHSGTMMGITNCISNICSLLAPLVVQVVVTDEDDQDQWKIIFFLSAAIYIGSNLFFVLFGSGEVQPWNDLEKENEKKKSQA